MAQKTIVYWKDIPTQIIVKAGRKAAKRELPEYFIQSVDQCAMRLGAKDSDAYLEEWRRGSPESGRKERMKKKRGSPEEVSGDLETEADQALEALIAAYPKARLKALIDAGGVDHGNNGP